MKTLQLVPDWIHDAYRHTGGRANYLGSLGSSLASIFTLANLYSFLAPHTSKALESGNSSGRQISDAIAHDVGSNIGVAGMVIDEVKDFTDSIPPEAQSDWLTRMFRMPTQDEVLNSPSHTPPMTPRVSPPLPLPVPPSMPPISPPRLSINSNRCQLQSRLHSHYHRAMIHPKQLVELPQQPKLNEEDINTFEIEHNVVFPDDYKQFMLTYNGANFGGNSFVCLNGMNLAMKTIYGLGISGYNDLNKRYGDQDCPKAYLKGILCIGQDACGSKIMLGMRGGDLGCVYFFEYESFLRPTTGFFKIANSFSELINGLVADE